MEAQEKLELQSRVWIGLAIPAVLQALVFLGLYLYLISYPPRSWGTHAFEGIVAFIFWSAMCWSACVLLDLAISSLSWRSRGWLIACNVSIALVGVVAVALWQL